MESATGGKVANDVDAFELVLQTEQGGDQSCRTAEKLQIAV